jgi:hypothetical protein
MDSVPTFAKVSLSSSALSNGSDKPLMRFSVTATDEDLAIAKFTIGVATTGVTVNTINVHAFTSSDFSSPVSGHSADGQLDNADASPTTTGGSVEIYAENSSGTTIGVVVPANTTRYFEVRGTVASAGTGDSAVITLQGDTAYPQLSGLMGTVATVDNDAGSNDDLIWSPYSTTTSGITTLDWTNGYGVPGLPASGFTETLSL